MKTVALLFVSAVAACAQGAPGFIELVGHTSTVDALSWSPDGKELASVGSDKSLRIWPAAGGPSREKKLAAIPTCVDWSPDGTSIATGGKDKAVRIWTAADFAAAGLEKEHSEGILAVDFSGDSREIVSVDEAGKFVAWELSKKRPRIEYEAGKADARAGAVSAPGYGVAMILGVGLTIFDLANQKELWSMTGAEADADLLAFSHDGRRVVIVEDRRARFWDLQTGKVVLDFQAGKVNVTAMALSRDGRFLATGNKDKRIQIWEVSDVSVASRKDVKPVELEGNPGTALCAAFSPDGGRLAVGSADKKIRIWNVPK